ncbi:DinB family protein [Candidatus Bathyarchaeota archaeon]|nr:DinB family protein [Candidatus Bathyarchaeota archaeon]
MEAVKLLGYSQYLRHRYLEALGKLPWEEVLKDRCASFNSLRNIYLHCVTVLDFYVNHLIQGDTAYPMINYDAYDNVEKINAYLEQVESKANAYLSKVTPQELARKIERKQRDGTTITVTVENILIDFFQEETHHRGELIALFWQMDVSPPHMGWTQYLNK